MKQILLLIMMLFATLVVQIKPVDGSSGQRVRNITQVANYTKSIGLSFSHSTSDTGTKFEFIYHPKKSKRIIVWHPTLVAIPTNKDGSPGAVISKNLKDRGGRQYSFTIANGRLKGSSFFLTDYTDGVQGNYIEFDLEAIVKSAKPNLKAPNN